MLLGECGLRSINIGSDSETVTHTSPGYPANYRNDLVCEWIVYATGTRRVLLQINEFHMEDRYDFLIVGNGIQSTLSLTLIARLTGITKIRTLTSTGSEMWLQIATDRTGTEIGFSVNLTQVSYVEGNEFKSYCMMFSGS